MLELTAKYEIETMAEIVEDYERLMVVEREVDEEGKQQDSSAQTEASQG
jgi:hypothetical protein